MFSISRPDPHLRTPLYRQVYLSITKAIENGQLRKGDRLPPTRELAAQIGLNRTTVTAAYGLLEEEGVPDLFRAPDPQ